MTELDTYNAPANAIAPAMMTVAENLEAHVAALKSADVLASMIHTTVQAYDGQKDAKGRQRAGRKEAAIAIYHGQQLGWNPLTSLQNIFTVHGVPGMYARAMRALLISKGHEVETVESTTKSATVRARHAGSENWEEVTWTIELATQAGYVAGNTKYKTDPRGMLYAKALADACRRAAPDVLMGMPYSKEDLEDERAVQASSERVDKPAPKGIEGLRDKLGVDNPSGPTIDEESPSDAAPEPEQTEVKPSTEDQQAALQQAFRKAVMDDLDTQLAWLGNLFNRDLELPSDLNFDEAAQALRELQS
ncbi:hypothetical protein CH278_01995 [Rhodococcus sp. 05-2254-5]|uniref:hypothetical protein n=1 Tax=unclassified Rhodococcus (in: high G+C Gram-positive bacteria) TaxID=192944 RepID=UPI000B9A3FE6|nr:MULTISPECIES: hypothetical protein [unclassified Rhodococcus (in: high G+C Gram-positive bacteria)]OZE39079.1 hypothetical protein CH278_01995 [Rhodococcus sp. 05-2254-5]OZE59020.1 hypothetical protein CH269_08490 [Rhodococcus sp. 05-2254-1]